MSLLFPMSIWSQSIDLEQFYMPQLQSKEDCAKYIGKKVCTFDYSSSNVRRKDSQEFSEYRTSATIHAIKKIELGKQIEISLESTNGYKRKVEINNGGAATYGELSSCNIFFLLDDFEAYKKELVGTIYKNKNNEDVAVLQNIELLFRIDDDPVLVSTLTSKINNKEFFCFSSDVEKVCSSIGTIVTNPKVKDSYRVLSASNSKRAQDVRFKYIYAEKPGYMYQNLRTEEIKSCIDPFESDLSGKYMSLLAEVERPTNSEIRYGETTKVVSEDGISKFSYKDNVIDILIFADRSSFNFVLQNVSNSSIKIIWDEAMFVNCDGSTERVIHKGVKYSEKDGPQSATTIIKNAKWEDSVVPTNLVFYREGSKYTQGGWDTRSMYPIERGLAPGQVKLMLPIQIKDVINEYIFVFDIKYVYDHPERLNLENL